VARAREAERQKAARALHQGGERDGAGLVAGDGSVSSFSCFMLIPRCGGRAEGLEAVSTGLPLWATM
jgi:hypothetical protein